MEGFWKGAAAVVIAVILGLSMGKGVFPLLVTLAASGMVAAAAMGFLEPVLELMYELERMADLPAQLLEPLLQAVGIALASEVVGKLCTDAGNASLGKSIELLGHAAVLYLSIPLVRTLMTLIRDILGGL